MKQQPAFRPRIVLMLCVLGLLATACGGGSASTTSANSGQTAAPGVATVEGSQAPIAGQEAEAPNVEEPSQAVTPEPTQTDAEPAIDTSNYPDFSSFTSDGEPFELIDHAGTDVLLWFWAPW